VDGRTLGSLEDVDILPISDDLALPREWGAIEEGADRVADTLKYTFDSTAAKTCDVVFLLGRTTHKPVIASQSVTPRVQIPNPWGMKSNARSSSSLLVDASGVTTES
jgi:hypothetical protein